MIGVLDILVRMQIAAGSTPVSVTPTYQARISWFGEVKRVPFTHDVSLKYGKLQGNYSSIDDALRAARLLSAGSAPAAVVAENLHPSFHEGKTVERDNFSVYPVEYDEWDFSIMRNIIDTGDYHAGDFTFTRGHKLDADNYSDGSPHEALVLVDGDRTWDNGIVPTLGRERITPDGLTLLPYFA